jgi:hypothetical protein
MNIEKRLEAAQASTAKHPPSGRVRVSDRLADPLVDEVFEAAAETGRWAKHDGWTSERIRTFLHALAACGVVRDAAAAAGMSRRTAYDFRNSAKGRAFHLAWNAALKTARHRLSDELMSRALHGCVEVIIRDGEVWGERHRFDNRLTMAVLNRLDEQVADARFENENELLIANEFDEFVDIVSAGGAGAASFIAARRAGRGSYDSREARLLRRLERYAKGEPGMPDGEDPSGPEGEDNDHAAAFLRGLAAYEDVEDEDGLKGRNDETREGEDEVSP